MTTEQARNSFQSAYRKRQFPGETSGNYGLKTFRPSPNSTNTVHAETKTPQDQVSTQKEVKTFRDLAIWQKGISLVKEIYRKTGSFPKDEQYGLVTQMRRAAVSIPSNIAEGYRRRHSKEFQQFLNVALGSLGEIETQLVIANELGYSAKEYHDQLTEQVDHLIRMTINLSKKVDR
jgi:four helix bundle protein